DLLFPKPRVHPDSSARAVPRLVPALFQPVFEPDRLVVVVPAGRLDGAHHLVDPHLLRLFRVGWAGGRRQRDRELGAHFAECFWVWNAVGLAIFLWDDL